MNWDRRKLPIPGGGGGGAGVDTVGGMRSVMHSYQRPVLPVEWKASAAADEAGLRFVRQQALRIGSTIPRSAAQI